MEVLQQGVLGDSHVNRFPLIGPATTMGWTPPCPHTAPSRLRCQAQLPESPSSAGRESRGPLTRELVPEASGVAQATPALDWTLTTSPNRALKGEGGGDPLHP